MITANQLIDCAAQTFRCAPESLTLESAYGETPNWDSVGHLRLIMAAEQLVDSQLDIDVIAEITTLQALLTALNTPRL